MTISLIVFFCCAHIMQTSLFNDIKKAIWIHFTWHKVLALSSDFKSIDQLLPAYLFKKSDFAPVLAKLNLHLIDRCMWLKGYIECGFYFRKLRFWLRYAYEFFLFFHIYWHISLKILYLTYLLSTLKTRVKGALTDGSYNTN